MYSFFKELFGDRTDGEIFTCFSLWHWAYLTLIVALIVFSILLFKGRSADAKRRGANLFLNIAFGLYVADLFIMPFALGEIDVDKLPFHSCTAMCVMSFVANHNRFFERFRLHFAMLGALTNLMYVVYPAGVMSYEITPLSYRAWQTLLFHSLMVVYCVLAVAFDEKGPSLRTCHKDALVLLCMTAWAFLGNLAYSGTDGDYSRDFNWFFLRRDPLDALPADISPYVSPFLNFALLFALELIICIVWSAVKKQLQKRAHLHGGLKTAGAHSHG